MKKSAPAASPAEYVSSLSGWQRARVEFLRAIVTSLPNLEERIKWGHLVYTFNGPRLREIENRLKPGGKYELATIELHDGDELETAVVRRLVEEAVALNESLDDPTHVHP